MGRRPAGSLYGQGVLGMTPLEYGLGTTVFTVGAVVGSFAAQRLVPRVGVGVVAAAGAALLGVGALLLTAPSEDGSYVADLLPGFAVFGPGLGAATVAASIAAVGSVPEEHSGVASGTNTAAFQLGGALGSAIVTTIVVSSGLGAGFGAGAVYAALRAPPVALLLPLRPAGSGGP